MGRFKYFPLQALSTLPLMVLYWFSSVLYYLLCYVLRYRKKVVIKNLIRSFPDDTPLQIAHKCKAFYRHFADLLMESLKGASISYDSLSKRFQYLNPGILEHDLQVGRSVILYTAHIGNWEWFSGLGRTMTFPVYTLYLPLSNPYFDGWMKKNRERFGIHALSASKAFRFLLKKDQAGEKNLSFYIGDQSPPNTDHVYWTLFLNQRTAFLTGTANMAMSLGVSVYFPQVTKVRRGFYQIKFLQLWDGQTSIGPEELVERYARALENAIIGSPELWLWSHNRWKHSPE